MKYLLYPFALLYGLATSLRNHLYNIEYKKSIHFNTVVLSVGNLSVGGTGKSPHVEYLIKLLEDKYKISTLSRGYGRKTRGFLLANEAASANTIGDEPMQFYNKFKGRINVAVGEERVLAIPNIAQEVEDNQVIILDDAFQHRKVERDLNILISDFQQPFYEDLLMPVGRLREKRQGAKRADIVIISKCPATITEFDRETIKQKVLVYARPETQIYFSKLKYGEPQPLNLNHQFDDQGKILLVTGIAKPQLLENYVKENYNFFKHLKFNDHHSYTKSDFQNIIKEYNGLEATSKLILTTEKDMVKWIAPELRESFNTVPVFYLPIEVEFVLQKEMFDKAILESIQKRLQEIK